MALPLMHRPHRSAIRALAAASASAAVATLLLATVPASAETATPTADPSPVAWSVQTVDNANGAGRANFSYELDPGATVHDAMRVVNTGTTALVLDVYAADAFTTPTGNLDVRTAVDPSSDAGLWVSTPQPQVSVAPGQVVDIPFTITVPADAAPGDHTAGLVTSYLSDDPTQSLSVDRRLGTRIYLRVGGELLPAASVIDLRTSYAPSWNPFEAGVLSIDYRVGNTGNTRIAALETIGAAGPLGAFATDAPPTALPEVLPGSIIDVHREIVIPAWGWLGGDVVVYPEAVGLGARSLDAISQDFGFLAIPWAAVVLLMLVAAITLLAVWLVRRNTNRPASDDVADSV